MLSGFTMAIRPQIVKSYAQGDLQYMHSLLLKGTKFSFFLTLIFVVPLSLNLEYILGLWLKEVPQYACVFSQMLLLSSLGMALSRPTIMAVHATGKLKKFQLVEGTLLLTIVPISYVGLKWFNLSPYSVIAVYLIVETLTQFVRVWIIYPMISLSIGRYFKDIILQIFKILIPIGITVYLLYTYNYCNSFGSLITNVLVSLIITVLSIYFLGLSSGERAPILNKIQLLKIRLNVK